MTPQMIAAYAENPRMYGRLQNYEHLRSTRDGREFLMHQIRTALRAGWDHTLIAEIMGVAPVHVRSWEHAICGECGEDAKFRGLCAKHYRHALHTNQLDDLPTLHSSPTDTVQRMLDLGFDPNSERQSQFRRLAPLMGVQPGTLKLAYWKYRKEDQS